MGDFDPEQTTSVSPTETPKLAVDTLLEQLVELEELEKTLEEAQNSARKQAEVAKEKVNGGKGAANEMKVEKAEDSAVAADRTETEEEFVDGRVEAAAAAGTAAVLAARAETEAAVVAAKIQAAATKIQETAAAAVVAAEAAAAEAKAARAEAAEATASSRAKSAVAAEEVAVLAARSEAATATAIVAAKMLAHSFRPNHFQ